MPPPRFDSTVRLFVEGRDDKHAVIHLLARHGYDWDDPSLPRPYVHETGGIDALLNELPVAARVLQRLGVVVDADLSLADRWAQVRKRVEAVGLELPSQPAQEGTIVAGPTPGSKIGFWLMPDNSAPGALEDFLHRLVPAEDPCWPYAREVVPEARKRGAPCPEDNVLKSTLHTWLAWQEEPGLPFGVALKAKSFAHDSEDARRFVAWFRRLFVDD